MIEWVRVDRHAVQELRAHLRGDRKANQGVKYIASRQAATDWLGGKGA